MDSEERSKDLATLQDERKEWQRLIDSSQWGKLIALMQGQVDEFQQTLLSPCTTRKQQMLAEYRKGQLEGRLSISNTVETLIEDLTEEIARITNG